MNTLLGRLVIGMIPGTVAAIIAIVIAWNYLDEHDHARENKTPCESKPCFIKLRDRVVALEAKMEVTTDKRYRSTDAERDKKELRDEMAKLRRELNERIDRMHK